MVLFALCCLKEQSPAVALARFHADLLCNHDNNNNNELYLLIIVITDNVTL